jgi:membrane protein DedA with SNARE-associated domain
MANQVAAIFSRVITDLKAMSLQKKLRLALLILAFLALTIGLNFGSRLLLTRIHIPMFNVAWITYLIVFGLFVTVSLVPFGPAAIAISVLFAAATILNPFMVGLAAAIGVSVGGLGGYFAGLLGRNVLLKENFMCSINEMLCNKNIGNWVKDKGPLVIGILALQPFLPFEVAGIVAGSLKMPIGKFFIATLAGSSIKYISLAFMAGILSSIPFIK